MRPRYHRVRGNRELATKGATPMIRYYLHYARYALAALATIGFGRAIN